MKNMLWGFVLVAIGVVLGLNALDITNIDLFFDGWWTLFIIVPCFINLFKNEDITSNFIGLVIGICLLLGCQDIVEFDLIRKLIVPFILVMIGISFIFKNTLLLYQCEILRQQKVSHSFPYHAKIGIFLMENTDFGKLLVISKKVVITTGIYWGLPYCYSPPRKPRAVSPL